MSTECNCYRCVEKRPPDIKYLEENSDLFFDMRFMQMFCCPKCGNKRCPHGTDHNFECTNSNEPGQKGSRYE